MTAPTIDLTFPHNWQAEILAARPMILPPRHFIYPANAEEVERCALELLVHPRTPAQLFLATCALGFRDPAVPTGVRSCPNPDEICAISGGYAYLIDTAAPEHFAMLPFRPVLEIRSLLEQRLLIFVGHHAILAWGSSGLAWQSEKLSDEGVTISSITVSSIEDARLDGLGWNMLTDKETPFALDLRTGLRV